MESWEVVARELVRDTIARYAHGADTGHFEALADCFTADGVLELEGEKVVGREAIRDFLGRQAQSVARTPAVTYVRHHVASTWIEVAGRAAATARSYFVVLTDVGVDHWGRYRDALVPDGDRWRFTRRTVRTEGRTPGGWGASLGSSRPEVRGPWTAGVSDA